MIRRLLPILLLLLCCPSIYAQSKQLLPAHGNRHGGNGLTIKESNHRQLKMSANIGAISLNDTTTKKGDFLELQTEGSYMSGAEGEPQLPAFRKLVQIPNGAKPKIVIKHADTTFYALSDLNIDKKLSPRQPSQSKSGKEQKFKYRKRSYRRNYFTKNALVTISQVGSMRGVEIGQVSVNPVRYNPKQNTLMVFSNIDFEIEFEGGSAKAGSNEATPYFNGVYTSLGNYKSPTVATSGQPVKYLIITDTAFVKNLQEFITWKRQKGFNVVVATTDTIGKSAANIKAWISAQYNSATEDNPAPSFLLLAADTDKIPVAKTGESSRYGTDLYYACMDGADDIIPDIYFGRFSARTAAQMKAIADKTIAYEKYQFEDPTYLAKATLIAGYDGSYRSSIGIPTVNYITNNRINTKNGYSTVNKYTSSYSGCYSDESVSVGLMTYTAHGEVTSWVDPALKQSKVREFGNYGKFPFVVANCCLSGQFDATECLGETWLRKENSGAVAYIGSSPKTYWDPDYFWAVGAHKIKSGTSPDTTTSTTGAFDTPFVSDYVCGGAIMFAGNMAVSEAWDEQYYDDVTPRYYWEGYNYLGDPSLLVYFGEAKNNTVSHSITIPTSSNMVTVNALSGSYVALSYNGELLGAAYVPNGESSVNVTITPIDTPCDIDIVVTKPRYKPYIGKITTILPDNSYLIVTNNPFKNKSMQYGSAAGFDITVNNLGQQASQSATVSITSPSPLIKSIGTTQTTIASIAALSSQTFTNLCRIELNENIADGTRIPFSFSVTEDGRTTTNEFSLSVTAPKLKLLATATIDKPNGQLFPGETGDIIVPITNTGHERVDLATVKLIADDGQTMVQVIGSEQTINNLNPGDTALCRFTIAASEYASMMTLFDFKIAATASQPVHSDTCSYTVTIGKLDDKIIGQGTSNTNLYPFNNWYKTGRTQIIYTTNDIGTKPIMIEEIAFQFATITPSNKFDGFKDFTIKMKYYDSDNLKGLDYFIDMSDAETVLKMDLMNIESNDLSLKFDKPFIYDGKRNVLLEIGWGMNPSFVEKEERPDIYCHSTKDITVASEFVDDADTPDDITKVYRRSDYRPNTTFRYQKPKYLIFNVTDTYGDPLPNIEIGVDNLSANTNANGLAELFTFDTRKVEYTINTIDYIVIQEDIVSSTDTVRISLQLQQLNVFAVSFHVIDSETRASVPNAKLTISNLQKTTNDLGLATFGQIPNRPLQYTVEAENYFIRTKDFSINADTLLQVEITKKPWITFRIHNDTAPQANLGVNISDIMISTDSFGTVTHIPQQFDTIPYSIALSSAMTITDTIFNLCKPTTIDINLALIDTTANNQNQDDDTTLQRTHSVIFCLSDGSMPIDSVLITMNGIEKNTDSTGCALFEGLTAGAEFTYTIFKDGYETTNGLKLLSDTIICNGNSIIRVLLRKQPDASLAAEYRSDIKIYPNPSDGFFFIENCEGLKISVITSDGKLVKTANVTGNKIDLRPLASGLYTLIIETTNGNVATQIVIR